MNLLNTIVAVLVCLFLPAYSMASGKTAFIYLNDDSGVMTDMAIVPDLRMLLIVQHKELKKKKRKYSDAQMVIISTSLARPVWYGKVSDLSSHRGGEVLERTSNNPKHCNQLAASFDAVRTAVVQLSAQGYNEIHISILSSLISTPVPCDTVKVELPQLPVPVEWAANLAPTSQVKSITFYGVNMRQYPLYVQALDPLLKWGSEDGRYFSIHDIRSTEDTLRYGLQGVDL